MAGDSRLSARFGADTTDFKNGIVAINRELKLVESGFKATASTMDDWSNTSAGLEARLNSLNKSIELQKEKVNALQYKLEDMKKVHGENSVEAQNAGIEFNKESKRLNELQKELGQTETSLKSMKGTTGGVKGAFKDLGTQFDALKQQVPALGTAFNLLTNPIALAVAGMGALAATTGKSISQFVTYNEKIRKNMQLTGLSAEETSRLIQVGDDWQIEMGTVTNAMELMNKKGITPSIENLAKIADEYVNATNKSTFMEEATKKYGKSFSDLIPILAKGGDELRKQTDAVADNMIATEKTIAITLEYQQQMDALADSATGLKNTLALSLLPAVNDTTGAFNNFLVSQNEVYDFTQKLKQAQKDGLISWYELQWAATQVGMGIWTVAEAEAWLLKKTGYLNKGERDLTITTKGLVVANEGLTAATTDNIEHQYDYNDALTAFLLKARIASTHNLAPYFEADAIAAEDAATAMQDLNDAIHGRLGPEMEDFTKKQSDLAQKMKDVQDEIDNAKKKYGEQSEKVLGLKGDLEELKGQYTANETEHDRATKEILYDMLEQKLGMNNLKTAYSEYTAAEILLLQAVATAWGLTDQATIIAKTHTEEALSYFADHPGDVAGFLAILLGQQTSWQATANQALAAKQEAEHYGIAIGEIPDKTVTVTTVHRDVWEGEAPPPPPDTSGHWRWDGEHWVWHAAHGLDAIVPPGFPNDTFPILASSGERVIVIPPGERFGNSLANLQQGVIQSTRRLDRVLNQQTNNFGGKTVDSHNLSNTYVIQAANPLQTSGDLARQVRLLELMH